MSTAVGLGFERIPEGRALVHRGDTVSGAGRIAPGGGRTCARDPRGPGGGALTWIHVMGRDPRGPG